MKYTRRPAPGNDAMPLFAWAANRTDYPLAARRLACRFAISPATARAIAALAGFDERDGGVR
jgi:hypothetical protein